MVKWRKTSDGWFTYYYNVNTGEKKFKLDKGDVEITDTEPLDDFVREPLSATED